jgi:hypothetical protein
MVNYVNVGISISLSVATLGILTNFVLLKKHKCMKGKCCKAASLILAFGQAVFVAQKNAVHVMKLV